MPRSTWREIGETARALIIAILVALFIRAFVVETFQVHGISMQPNLQNGERLLVNKFQYRFSKPQIGQIIIFHPPQIAACPEVGPHPDDYVKRVIALAGETVSLSNGAVYVDGKLQPEPYLPLSWRSGNFAPYTVPAGDVWVLGDHRAVSLDSRCYGPIALSRIVGRVMLIWWPFNNAKWLGW